MNEKDMSGRVRKSEKGRESEYICINTVQKHGCS